MSKPLYCFFITGKKRLPLYDLGEDKISVNWTGNQLNGLPIAQNCTHTLILPLSPDIITPEMLSPIFDFETVYGFL